MSEPSETGCNGGRTSGGKFAPGNKCSRGNGIARKAATFRAKLFRSVSATDFGAIVRQLVQEAKAGKPWAVKLALEYLAGPPRDVELEERLQALEAALEGRRK
jgi:hypothetical protein